MHPDVDVYTKTRIHRKTLRKTQKTYYYRNAV